MPVQDIQKNVNHEKELWQGMCRYQNIGRNADNNIRILDGMRTIISGVCVCACVCLCICVCMCAVLRLQYLINNKPRYSKRMMNLHVTYDEHRTYLKEGEVLFP